MFNTSEKKERALGTKLFLKADRCNSPKCAAVRRPQQRPGVHGKARRRAPSEVGKQLHEKQKIRFTYGVSESQLRQVFAKATSGSGVTGEVMIGLLERRLDNVIYRLGLAPSRAVARQLVGHGHFIINKRKITIPSYEVKKGDIIAIKPSSQNHLAFKDLEMTLKKYDSPQWLDLDKEKKEGKVITLPTVVEEETFDVDLVVDYYVKRM